MPKSSPGAGSGTRAGGWVEMPSALFQKGTRLPMKQTMKQALNSLVISSLLLTGCAATGVRYDQTDIGKQDVQPRVARLTVIRTQDSSLYSARAAALKLDGASIGGIDFGGFRVLEIAPGKHKLATDMWDSPGLCELEFEARAGMTTFFEVTPRKESFFAGMPGMVLATSTTTPAGVAAGIAAMIGGVAAEAASVECGGAFSIREIEPSSALPRLSTLRASN